jgi:ABC-2 type transport system permease protein
MLNRVRQIIIKEFIQVWRDRRLRIFLFLPPLIQMIIYGYATNFDIRHVPTGIYDEDRSVESQKLISRFGSTEYFRLQQGIANERELRRLLDRGEITLVLHIPADFADKLKAGQTATLQIILDATDSNAALIIAKYVNSILHDYSQEILLARLHQAGSPRKMALPVIIESSAWFNPNLISRVAFVPGVIAIVVMLVSLMLTGMAVVREKELGTLEQVLVTPIKPLEFMLGKTIPFVCIALMDVILVSVFAMLWFDIPFRGSPVVLFLGTLAFLFSSVGLGLLISTVSSTQQQTLMAGTFLMTPAILLSGLIFPIANMPKLFQYITYINPLRYYITVVQGIFLKGVGIGYLWQEMTAMLVMGLVMLTLSVKHFSRQS